MSSQQFFGLSLVIGVLFIVLFLWPRSKQDPSRLKMGYRGNLPDLKGSGARGLSPEALEAEKEARMGMHFEADGVAESKSLNVIFNYNGHSWDAFEVLGVPAGAGPSAVESAYKKTLAETDRDSHDFVRTAFEAIKKSR